MLYKCLFCLLLLGQIRPVIFPGGCFNSFYPRPSINRRDNFISTWVAYSPNINIFTPISVIPSSYTTLPWPWPPVLFPPHHLPSFLLHYNQFKDQTSTDLNVIQVLLDWGLDSFIHKLNIVIMNVLNLIWIITKTAICAVKACIQNNGPNYLNHFHITSNAEKCHKKNFKI